jgi:hypothetical protein
MIAAFAPPSGDASLAAGRSKSPIQRLRLSGSAAICPLRRFIENLIDSRHAPLTLAAGAMNPNLTRVV